MSTSVNANYAAVGPSVGQYLARIRAFPMLTPEDEYMFASRYRDHHDPKAAEALATSHLRLVAKTAMSHRGYGLPIADIIAEGNIGLMTSIQKFDPDKGFRLATYAIWWIRAAIQEFVLRSYSLVKIGTTTGQKRLFFGLRRAKAQIAALEEGDLRPENAALLADRFGVAVSEVIDMNRRLGGDGSLNATTAGRDPGEDWQDRLVDDRPDAEARLLANEESELRHAALTRALAVLTERERAIFSARRLSEVPTTLDALGRAFGISRERVSQIEARAFTKIQEALLGRKTDLVSLSALRERPRRSRTPSERADEIRAAA